MNARGRARRREHQSMYRQYEELGEFVAANGGAADCRGITKILFRWCQAADRIAGRQHREALGAPCAPAHAAPPFHTASPIKDPARWVSFDDGLTIIAARYLQASAGAFELRRAS